MNVKENADLRRLLFSILPTCIYGSLLHIQRTMDIIYHLHSSWRRNPSISNYAKPQVLKRLSCLFRLKRVERRQI